MSGSDGDSDIIFQSGQVLLRPPPSSIHGPSSLCSDWEFMPGWETGSPSRTRFLTFSGIPSLNLGVPLGAGIKGLQPWWVRAAVMVPKGMVPWALTVRLAAIPSSSMVSSWARAGSGEGGSPSSSIWVPPRTTASQFSEPQPRSAGLLCCSQAGLFLSPASPVGGRG